MAWDHLCHPKNHGGLGFRHLHDFKKALLSKAIWCFLADKDSLYVQVIKAKYRVGRELALGIPSKKKSLGLGRVSTMRSQII